MRESWTDERLDYLSHRVDEGFKQVNERISRVESGVERMDERFDQMNDCLLGLHKLMLQGGIALFSMMVVGFATVLAASL